eukprot:Skav222874  [mRNA]  locus=scaffold2201:491183:494643:+ [translate_table: standard]
MALPCCFSVPLSKAKRGVVSERPGGVPLDFRRAACTNSNLRMCSSEIRRVRSGGKALTEHWPEVISKR